MKVAVCEDDPREAAQLRTLIESSGVPAETALYGSAEDLVRAFRPGIWDLILLDIYMGGMSGVEAARAIREKDGMVMLAFATTSPDHTFEGYSLKALRYLIKPVRAADAKETLELAEMNRRLRKSITLLSGGSRVEIPLDAILYFEQRAHDIAAHTTSGEVPVSRTAGLDAIAAQLPSPPFFRCHKSFLVNFNYVQNVGRDFLMSNGGVAYIRRDDVKKCAAAFQNWMMDGGAV